MCILTIFPAAELLYWVPGINWIPFFRTHLQVWWNCTIVQSRGNLEDHLNACKILTHKMSILSRCVPMRHDFGPIKPWQLFSTIRFYLPESVSSQPSQQISSSIERTWWSYTVLDSGARGKSQIFRGSVQCGSKWRVGWCRVMCINNNNNNRSLKMVINPWHWHWPKQYNP